MKRISNQTQSILLTTETLSVTYPAALRARAAFLTPAQASTYQRLAAARNSFLELAAARNNPFRLID